MEYPYTIDLGEVGDVEATIMVDDSFIEGYASDHLDMIAASDAEEWTHDNVPLSDWLDREGNPIAALKWVLKNVEHEKIIEALEKEMGAKS